MSSISDNRAIVGPSTQLAIDLRNAFESATGEPPSNYTGQDGIVYRSDLGRPQPVDGAQGPHRVRQHAQRPRTPPSCRARRGASCAAQGIATGLEQFLEVAERT